MTTTRKERQEAHAKAALRCQSVVLLGYCVDFGLGQLSAFQLSTICLSCTLAPEHKSRHLVLAPPKISAAHFVQERRGKHISWEDTPAMLVLRRLKGAPDVPVLLCSNCQVCKDGACNDRIVASVASAARWYSESNAYKLDEPLQW